MADPVSLVLGIAPLCIVVIKGISILLSKLKLFLHHRKEVIKIWKKLKIRGEGFRMELKWLLLDVIEPRAAISMIENLDHPQWQTEELDAEVRAYLGCSYDSFQETLDEVRETIDDLLGKLSSFATPKTAVPLSKSTNDAFQIVFKKKEYIESLDTLKECNTRLREIRKLASKIETCRTKAKLLSLPSGYEAVQDMSLSLYDLLHTRSSCNAGANSRHSIKLILSSTDETAPSINLLFEHKVPSQSRVMLPLHASCKNLGCIDSGLLTPESCPEADQGPKWRRVRSTHHTVTTQAIPMYQGDHNECEGEDFTKTRVKCEQLIISSALRRGVPPRSLGYLDVKCSRRLILYPGVQGLGDDSDCLKLRKVTPLLDFLKFPVYDVVSDKDRLKLAITLAKSMLKYNSTPWWPQEWTLGQVYVLPKGTRDLSSSLNTLHLSTEIEVTQSTIEGGNRRSTTPDKGDHYPDSLPLESVQYAMDNHGIRNLTLYGLGVALLQIGLWDHVAWEDHIQVRQKIALLTFLGKRYRDATKRLIYCDFGLATEQLEDVKLQSAIFTEVVGVLELLLQG
ncbi:hypothetical protein F5Y13DRAFT_202020 [Hypoxylon sp. FL1857]|nr:hypothetical protein F5Y13DRAFT_202020 [Hypoxylon sp. FL1857]